MTIPQSLFLVASAVGATIIISRGDIFKPFREWLNNKAIRKKLFVHDFELTNPGFKSITIDGDVHKINDHHEQETIKHICTYLNDVDSVRKEKTNSGKRIFIECASSHSINLTYEDRSVGVFNVYPKLIYRPLIKYIADLISCPQCSGLWIGMGWYGLYLLGWMQYWWFLMFCTGCIVSAVAYFYFKAYSWLEKK